MFARLLSSAPSVFACVCAFGAAPAALYARNCPVAVEQTVAVVVGRPALFTLDITNPDGSKISVFQYPLGGVLQQVAVDSPDFVFLPAQDFSGTTSFTYRLEPPRGCDNGTKLVKVTLVGGLADGTAAGLLPPPEEPPPPLIIPVPAGDLCGTGSASLPLYFFVPITAFALRRR